MADEQKKYSYLSKEAFQKYSDELVRQIYEKFAAKEDLEELKKEVEQLKAT